MSNKKKKKNSNYQTSAKTATKNTTKPASNGEEGVSVRPIKIIIFSVIALVLIAAIVLISLNSCYGGECYYADNRDVSDHDVVYAEMSIKGYGKVTLLLDRTTAPITVDNFVSLVNDGFYDGLTFHRIIKGFMIQGGDPDANGTGGSENKIYGEFSANGHHNDISHIEGVISMARSTPYDSASSQFFICNADYPSLNGNYAAFGYVIDGLNVIHRVTNAYINKTDHSADYGELEGGVIKAKGNQPVIEYIKILE